MLPHMELCSMLVFMSFFSFIFILGGEGGEGNMQNFSVSETWHFSHDLHPATCL